MVDTSQDIEYIVTTNPVTLGRSGDEKPVLYSHNETLRVDILFKLYIHKLWMIVRTILLSLPPVDLYRAAHVSKRWRMICSSDRSLNIKRKKYYNQIQKIRLGSGKENVSIILPRVHTVLHSIAVPQTVCAVSPKKMIQFPNGIYDKHIKCPFCSSAATNLFGNKFICKMEKCRSEFCSACLQKWQPSHEVKCKQISCSPDSSPSKLLTEIPPPPKPLIGHILSRRRLKRLLK